MGTIVKVKELLKKVGLLFAGDNKRAALETRGRIAKAKDYYLMPLPHTGQTAQLIGKCTQTRYSGGIHGS